MSKFMRIFIVMMAAVVALVATPSVAYATEGSEPVSSIVDPTESSDDEGLEGSEEEADEEQRYDFEQDAADDGVLPEDAAPIDDDLRLDVSADVQPELQVDVSTPVVVTLGAPTKVVEPCYPPVRPEQRFVKIGFVTGVQFFVNGTPVDETSYLVPVVTHEAIITAVALDGYVIEGESEWFIPFDYKECPSDIVMPELIPPLDDIVLPPLNDAVLPTGLTSDVGVSASDDRPATLAVTGASTTANLVMVIAAILMAFGLVTMLRKLPKKDKARKR